MRYFSTLRGKTAYVMAYMAALFVCGLSGTAFGQVIPPNLGTTATYGAFSGEGAISNTGLTQITGDIGTNAGAFTGFPPGLYSGARHVADPQSLAAKNDLIIAWNASGLIPCDTTLSVTLGNGQVLTPRTYCLGPASTITGNLTFDAKGDPDAVFVVKVNGALSAASGVRILLANGAQAVNIYWRVNGAVEVLGNSVFKGTVIANGAIQLYSGSTLEGRALALVGAVTLAANNVAVPMDESGAGDTLIVVRPVAGDSIRAGMRNYQITWAGSGIDARKTLDYSLDSGRTWIRIAAINANVFIYNWNVPDTSSARAVVRITDNNGVVGKSGVFVIARKKPDAGTITVVRPAAGEIIVGGTANYQITWNGTNIAAVKTFEYSLNGGSSWTTIGTLTGNQFTYPWAMVPNVTTTQARIRITDSNRVSAVSGLFTIIKDMPDTGTIIVVRPAAGEIVVGGTANYQITWAGLNIAAMKTFEYSLDGGSSWNFIGTLTGDQFTYPWAVVPNVATTRAMIRITDANNVTATSGMFTISKDMPDTGTITVVRPATGEIIAGGTPNYQITWNGTNIAAVKTLEYSLDGGSSWNSIGTFTSAQFTYAWSVVPNVATTQAMVRITDANNVTATSGMFTITRTVGAGLINSLTLSGLDNMMNIGNSRNLGIDWTFTPDIGTSVEVEYSLDGMMTWGHIATVQTSAATTTSWLTPSAGYHNPVVIRLTSSNGMIRTSEAFSIGQNSAGVYSSKPTDGYSLTNYPSPVSGRTTISFELPVAGDVTLTISNGLGDELENIVLQHADAGTHTVPFDASGLAAGAYYYTLRAGSAMLVGRMIVVK